MEAAKGCDVFLDLGSSIMTMPTFPLYAVVKTDELLENYELEKNIYVLIYECRDIERMGHIDVLIRRVERCLEAGADMISIDAEDVFRIF
ncbi:hypothetical protein Tco_1124546 [Tanacetum coccineum]|uniref:Uncharacterized protein n=1 Tax=Tanacetum coccineum TaxID=301880 RepID=A0ABQ5J738_9ASTR